MTVGFDMKTEIAKLATRIVEPVSAKVPAEKMEAVVGQIRYAFEQLNDDRTPANTNFQAMVSNILEPIRPTLSEAEFGRIADRPGGAMAAFCLRGLEPKHTSLGADTP
jgi:hypothetical protein